MAEKRGGALLQHESLWMGHAWQVEMLHQAAFSAALADFPTQGEAGRSPPRDPHAVTQSITGIKK
jgi:hypothetical protein